MPRYARETTVPVERSKAEIEDTLKRYGATAFQSGWDQKSAWIGFCIEGLFIRFMLPMPDPTDKRFTHRQNMRTKRIEQRTEQQAWKEWDQEIRQRWRALLLVVKAKLEAVDCLISTIEREFLAFIVMPNDKTLGDWFAAEALPAIRDGKMPLLGLRDRSKEVEADSESKDGRGNSRDL